MAKISANGATEVARITTRDLGGYRHIYVMTSDGRVLRRWADQTVWSGYTVLRRKVHMTNRNKEFLQILARQAGHTIEERQ